MTDTSTFSLSSPNSVWKHALATPLTILRLAIEQATHQATQQQLQLPQLKQALKQLEYVTTLLYQPNHQPWSLRSVLHGTIQRMDCSTLRRAKLVDNLQHDYTFLTSSLDFQEALSCAISNSWEAYLSHDHAVVVINVYSKQNTIFLHIQDFGQGMSWLHKRLLGRGKTTKAGHHGIGTTFIQQVIEKDLRGKVLYQSYVGVGTTQIWQLPIPSIDNQTLE